MDEIENYFRKTTKDIFIYRGKKGKDIYYDINLKTKRKNWIEMEVEVDATSSSKR